VENKEPKVVIDVKNLTKTFNVYYDKANTLKERLIFFRRNNHDVRVVLDNINLQIQKGETVALIGVNGSGKSTLLKLMTKIIFPNKGTVKVNGRLTSLLELGAGFHPDFSGRENIYFNSSIFGLTKKQIESRVNDIIEFSELEPYMENPVRTYSSGMYMRLAFAIAINVDADILLIDEILAVGDQHFQEKCYDKLRELKEKGKTIVIVSHDLTSIQRLCDRSIWLNNGRIRIDGKTEDVIPEYIKECT
jgi:ABC-type polysaccharide/polyol phosphate transport system ATPase subunit